jgi:hypothetical protein
MIGWKKWLEGRRQGLHTEFWWGKPLLGRLRSRRQDNIKTELRETADDGTVSGSCAVVLVLSSWYLPSQR